MISLSYIIVSMYRGNYKGVVACFHFVTTSKSLCAFLYRAGQFMKEEWHDFFYVTSL